MSDTAGVIHNITTDLTVIEDLAAKAALGDVRVVADDDLLGTALRVGMARRFLDATESHVLAELEARGTTTIVEGKTTAHWLAEHTGIAKTVAAKRVRVGCKLRDPLGRVGHALTHGQISWDHAAVISGVANPRIIDDIAAIQQDLIGLVGGATFERFTAEVRGIAEQLDADGGHDPRSDESTNELHFDVFPDGTVINGTLVGDIELSITTALDAETDRLFREFSADHERTDGAVEIPKRSTLRAMALAELCRKGRATDENTSKAAVPDVTLVINADDPFHAFTTDGRRITDAAAAVLCCDPGIHTLLINSLGVPLDLGHEVRYANRAQRRALAQRDGGCVFPGCGAHVNWCDAHHVIPWKPNGAGGPTNLANLALMCRRHHRVVHRPGWSMTATDDQRFTFATPTGDVLQSQRHQRAGPAPPG